MMKIRSQVLRGKLAWLWRAHVLHLPGCAAAAVTALKCLDRHEDVFKTVALGQENLHHLPVTTAASWVNAQNCSTVKILYRLVSILFYSPSFLIETERGLHS